MTETEVTVWQQICGIIRNFIPHLKYNPPPAAVRARE